MTDVEPADGWQRLVVRGGLRIRLVRVGQSAAATTRLLLVGRPLRLGEVSEELVTPVGGPPHLTRRAHLSRYTREVTTVIVALDLAIR